MAFFNLKLLFFYSTDFKENADPSAEKQTSSVAPCDATPSIRYFQHLPMFATIDHILTSPGPIKFSFCP